MKLTRHISHVVFIAYFVISQTLPQSVAWGQSDCESVIKKLSFRQLESAAARSAHKPTVKTPYWFETALPEGMTYIPGPGREHAPNRVHKEFGEFFVGIQSHFNHQGNFYTTTVGLNPQALVDNIFRTIKNQPKLLTREHDRAVGLFGHGGGTNLSSWGNGNNAASQFGKRDIGIVSFDFFGHGANRNGAFSETPADYTDFPLWFMNKYFSHKTPQFFIGHSMGGQIGDLLHLHTTPAELEHRYPGLPFKAIVAMSPPTDPTYGADLYTKISRDREFTDRGAQEKLFDNDNINLPSQEVLTDLAYLVSWNDQMLENASLPALSQMGLLDDVCYMGCEDAYQKGFASRNNTQSILYDNVVDHNGDSIKPDHMLPKYFLPGQNKSKGIIKNIPIAFADAIQFVERTVIGDPEFNIHSPEIQNLQTSTQTNEAQQVDRLMKWRAAENNPISRAEALKEVQEINALRAYKGSLTRVLSLFAKNLVFRKFVENYSFKKKVLASHETGAQVNAFVTGISNFINEYSRYEKRLTNPQVQLEQFENWKIFSRFVQEKDPSAKAEAERLFAQWSKNENSSYLFAASLLAKSLNIPFARSIDLPAGFPVNLDKAHQILSSNSSSSAKEIAELKELIMGYRDLDMNAMAKLFPELETLRDETFKIFAEHRELSNHRNKTLLPALVKLYAQQIQMQKLFAKDTLASLTARGAKLENMLIQAEAQNLISKSSDFDDAMRKYEALVEAGWKYEIFESYLGPDARNFISNLHARYLELEKLNPEKLKLAQNAFLNSWNEGIDDLHGSLQAIKGSIAFENKTTKPLEDLLTKSQKIRNEALDILSEFFELRENFIKENHHLWTRESRPSYPPLYYKLIKEYEGKQIEYQRAKSTYEKQIQKQSLQGELGPYMKFLTKKFKSLSDSIAKINGKEDDTIKADGEASLTAAESRIQEIEVRLESIEEHVINQYAQNLYRSQKTSAWDVFNNKDELPSSEQINKILDAWNRIWRDPTGGQVQDSTAY